MILILQKSLVRVHDQQYISETTNREITLESKDNLDDQSFYSSKIVRPADIAQKNEKRSKKPKRPPRGDSNIFVHSFSVSTDSARMVEEKNEKKRIYLNLVLVTTGRYRLGPRVARPIKRKISK